MAFIVWFPMPEAWSAGNGKRSAADGVPAVHQVISPGDVEIAERLLDEETRRARVKMQASGERDGAN